jgi:hypothetical protein
MYFKVDYTIHGKTFNCFVKTDKENKCWTCVYINPFNPKNDCFIRREVGSPFLLKNKIDTDERTFISALEQVYAIARYL